MRHLILTISCIVLLASVAYGDDCKILSDTTGCHDKAALRILIEDFGHMYKIGNFSAAAKILAKLEDEKQAVYLDKGDTAELLNVDKINNLDVRQVRIPGKGVVWVTAKDLYCKTAKKYESLTQAVDDNQLREVIRLLNEGADVDTRDYTGSTPLINASYDGYLEVVRLLLDRGADINAKGHLGWTALINASNKQHLEVIKLLLDKGADVNAMDYSGLTALRFAAGLGYLELIKLLLDRGADIDARANAGDTPLMDASQSGHSEVVRLLLDKGADVNIRDYDGDTALKLASKEGHRQVVKLLKAHGAKR